MLLFGDSATRTGFFHPTSFEGGAARVTEFSLRLSDPSWPSKIFDYCLQLTLIPCSFLFHQCVKNKSNKRSAFECKCQISLENISRNESQPVNRYLSMPKLQAAGKFLSDLISYLSGKNIIAEPKVCPEMGSGVAA